MKNLGILLSGRGSNFVAIADSIAAGRIPDARIAVVISNRADAPRPCPAPPPRPNPLFHFIERQAARGTRSRSCGCTRGQQSRSHLPRRLHAPAFALVRAAVSREDSQHPSVLATRVSRPG